MGLEAPDAQARLREYLQQTAESPVEINRVEKMSGGAIQENWALDISVAAGKWAGDHALVLRKDAATQVTASHGRREEYRLLKAAKVQGVPVPTPCFLCEDQAVLGHPFFLMHRLQGTAAGHQLTKGDGKPRLVKALGQTLARIHNIIPPVPDLDFLGAPPTMPAQTSVETYRGYLDEIGATRPALEYGLAWLERNAPASSRVTLCHRDYRTGNLMVDGDMLAGVLDWEFAGWNDPMEDIGWFMARCWRFASPEKEAGGLGEREDFYQAYEAEAGYPIDRDQVPYWEVMAHARWAAIACQQAHRHASGAEVSLELALTAYVVPELELEILKMTGEG